MDALTLRDLQAPIKQAYPRGSGKAVTPLHAEVTLRSVATAMSIEIRSATLRARGSSTLAGHSGCPGRCRSAASR